MPEHERTHHVHVHIDLGPGLGDVLKLLQEIRKDVKKMSAELDRLTTEVSETSTVVDSAVALIQGLAEQIRQLATDPAALNALADSLDTKTNELAAAVAANTSTPPGP